MNVLKRLPMLFATIALALVAGLGLTTVTQSVNTPKASADVVALYISPTSEHVVRACSGWDGHSVCVNTRPGHWVKVPGIGSVQVDRGCELYQSGVRVAKRKNYDWWFNYKNFRSKATIALRNCR